MNFAALKIRVAITNLGRDDIDSLELAGKCINEVLTIVLPAKGLKPFLRNTDITTTADQEYVDLPANFMSLKLARLEQSDGNYVKLTQLDWDDLEVSDTGEPDYFDILPSTTGWRMYLRLIPDDTYTINIWYYAKETELSDDSDTAILSALYGDDIIISGATWRMCVVLGLDNDASRWGTKFFQVDLPAFLSWQGNMRGSLSRGRPYNPYK